MWPIGGSSCNQTLNPKAFCMLPMENASIGALKTEKTKKTNTNLISFNNYPFFAWLFQNARKEYSKLCIPGFIKTYMVIFKGDDNIKDKLMD